MRRWFVLWLCLGILCAGGVSAQNDNDDLLSVPVIVEEISLNFNPAGGFLLDVRGVLGTGCQLPVDVTQTVDGTTLEVAIFQFIPAATICPLLLVGYADVIPIEPPPGVLRVRVNAAQTFDLPGAQTAPTLPETRSVQVEAIIETVEITPNGLLNITGQHRDGCDLETQTDVQLLADDWLVVRVYRDVPQSREVPQNTMCPTMLQDFSLSLIVENMDLDVAMRDIELLEVNDLAFILQFGDIEFSDGVTTLMEIVPAERDFLQVEGRTVTDDMPLQMRITGTFTDGCEARVLVRGSLREGRNIFDILAYRLVPLDHDRICPAVMRNYTVIYTFPEDLEFDLYTYDINMGGATGAFFMPEISIAPINRADRVLHFIDAVSPSVDADGNVLLNIIGYIPDGCETQELVDIISARTVVTVEIYREIPPGIMCPMMIVDYDGVIALGVLPPGDYTIIVNGVTVEFSF